MEFERGQRVTHEQAGDGTVEKRRWNRWYAQHEYLVRFDQAWQGLTSMWSFANELKETA